MHRTGREHGLPARRRNVCTQCYRSGLSALAPFPQPLFPFFALFHSEVPRTEFELWAGQCVAGPHGYILLGGTWLRRWGLQYGQVPGHGWHLPRPSLVCHALVCHALVCPSRRQLSSRTMLSSSGTYASQQAWLCPTTAVGRRRMQFRHFLRRPSGWHVVSLPTASATTRDGISWPTPCCVCSQALGCNDLPRGAVPDSSKRPLCRHGMSIRRQQIFFPEHAIVAPNSSQRPMPCCHVREGALAQATDGLLMALG